MRCAISIALQHHDIVNDVATMFSFRSGFVAIDTNRKPWSNRMVMARPWHSTRICDMTKRTELLTDWTNGVAADELPLIARKHYEEYRALRRKANEAREAFELEMNKLAPAGTCYVFNYKFGKLSIAQAEGDRGERSAVAPSKPKLADFLAAAKANGRNV
jgi:hypothetical protein